MFAKSVCRIVVAVLVVVVAVMVGVVLVVVVMIVVVVLVVLVAAVLNHMLRISVEAIELLIVSHLKQTCRELKLPF